MPGCISKPRHILTRDFNAQKQKTDIKPVTGRIVSYDLLLVPMEALWTAMTGQIVGSGCVREAVEVRKQVCVGVLAISAPEEYRVHHLRPTHVQILNHLPAVVYAGGGECSPAR